MSQKPKRWDELPEWVRKAALRWHRGELKSNDERAELANYLDLRTMAAAIDEVCRRTLAPYELEMRSQQAREAEERMARAEDWVRIGQAIAGFARRCEWAEASPEPSFYEIASPSRSNSSRGSLWRPRNSNNTYWAAISPATPPPPPLPPSEWMTVSEYCATYTDFTRAFLEDALRRYNNQFSVWQGHTIRIVPDDTQWGVWLEYDAQGDCQPCWVYSSANHRSRAAADVAASNMRCIFPRSRYSVRPYPMGAER